MGKGNLTKQTYELVLSKIHAYERENGTIVDGEVQVTAYTTIRLSNKINSTWSSTLFHLRAGSQVQGAGQLSFCLFYTWNPIDTM